MNLWIDAQLSPALAPWINECFKGVNATSLKRLGLRDAADIDVFMSVRKADAVVMTKDSDFMDLLWRLGPPPRIIWLSFGNTKNVALRSILQARLPLALQLLSDHESLVEIR